MTASEIIALLEQHQNERSMKNWEKNPYKGNLRSLGMGITQVKNIAKKIKKNHELALELWQSDYFEAKLMSVLLEEPKKITREQVEKQAEDLGFWMLSSSYVSTIFPGLEFSQELTEQWRKSSDPVKRRCGYLVLYGAPESKTPADEAKLINLIAEIEKNIQAEENFVKDAMNNALYGIGRVSKRLNAAVIEAAGKIGKLHVDYGDNSCEPLDILKHLTNERIQKSLS